MAPIENFRAAIMTVGAEQDFRPRPMAPDRAEQAPEKRLNLLAARTFCGPQDACDKAAFAVEDDDGLKTVFVIMRVEEAQLLAAMHGIEGIVDVEHDPFRHLLERLTIKIDHGTPHPQQRARI